MTIGSEEWEEAAQALECSLMILRKDKNGWVIGFSVHPDEAPGDVLSAALVTRFQCVLFEMGDDERPVPSSENQPVPDNYIDLQQAKARDPVTVAGILCRDPVFQGWMLASTVYINGADDVEYEPKKMEKLTAEELRKRIGVESRSNIRKSERAKKLFEELVKDFRAFKIETELEFPWDDEDQSS